MTGNTDTNLRFDLAVRFQNDLIKIPALIFFEIFDTQNVSRPLRIIDLGQVKTEMLSFFRLGFKYPERIFCNGYDPGLSPDRTACIASQDDPRRSDLREFFNLPVNRQYQAAVFLVVGVYGCLFPGRSAAVSFGVYLKGDLSLSTGRDLPRIRDRCAPSAGFYLHNLQYSRPPVFHNEIVDDLGAIHNQWECIAGCRHFSDRAHAFIFRVCKGRCRYKHATQINS